MSLFVGFRVSKIHKRKVEQLELAGCPINLTDPHLLEVKSYAESIASEFKQKVKEEVKGKPISLMIDIATKNHRSILGVSIQYIWHRHPKVVTIIQSKNYW